ncbi:hypothetical protein pb186bvf_000205 [Paramecium bursaria]
MISEQIKLIQRDINCMIDQDRNIRRQGISKINDYFKDHSNPQDKILIFDGYIIKNVLRALEDQVEKHRELTLQLITNYLNLSNQEYNFEIMKLILEAIIQRLNTLPFLETSEEIRLQLIQLLKLLLVKQHSCFRESLQKIAHMFSKAFQDNFPEMKKESAIFASELSKAYPIGEYMGDSIKILTINMQHAHTKVRKSSVESLANIILSRVNGSFLDISLNTLKLLSFDKSTDVRKSTFKCISDLLMQFSINNLNIYENQLLLILLNGLSDENADIQHFTIEALDQVGVKRNKLDQETQ